MRFPILFSEITQRFLLKKKKNFMHVTADFAYKMFASTSAVYVSNVIVYEYTTSCSVF